MNKILAALLIGLLLSVVIDAKQAQPAQNNQRGPPSQGAQPAQGSQPPQGGRPPKGGQNEEAVNVCGESTEVAEAWKAALDAAKEQEATREAAFDAAMLAAIEAGADNETATCLAILHGRRGKAPLCEVINSVNTWWINRLGTTEGVEAMTDEAVAKVKTDYTTYAELCGDRPVYESAAESTEEESSAAEEGSSETVEESEVTTGTSP